MKRIDNDRMNRNYYAVIPANVRYDKNLIPSAKLLYGEITALCNEKGYCWASNEYFAELYDVSKTSIKKWLKSLEDNRYIERKVKYKGGSKEIDTRWITIVAYPQQEKLPTPRQEKCPDNNTVINNTINTTTEEKNSSSNQDLKERFDTIWKEYPNKKGKEKAFKAYKKAIKEGIQDEKILAGLNRYKQEIQLKRIEQQFIAHGSTWFNQMRWDDEYTQEPERQLPSYELEDVAIHSQYEKYSSSFVEVNDLPF